MSESRGEVVLDEMVGPEGAVQLFAYEQHDQAVWIGVRSEMVAARLDEQFWGPGNS